MTAVIAAKFPDKVELLTDRAITATRSGLLWGEATRPVKLGSLPAVLVARGTVRFTNLAADAVGRIFESAATVDKAIAELERDPAQPREPAEPHAGLEVTICAISEARSPSIWWFQNRNNVLGWPAWKLRQLEFGISIAEPIPDWAIGRYTRPGSLAGTAVYLMNERREAGFKDPVTGQSNQSTGAGIDLTVVDAAGVTTRTVYNWPCDHLGEPMTGNPPHGPEHRLGQALCASDAAPANQPTTRRERRAMAAQARKKSA